MASQHNIKTAFKTTFALLFLFSFILAGCQPALTGQSGSKSQSVSSINESAIVAEYMEKENVLGKLMGTSLDPIGILMEIEDRPEGIVVIDLRSSADYAAGHIPGAVNVNYKNLIEYYEKNDLQSRKFVVLTSNSGQLARYVQGLMQMADYKNVFFPKWGMSSWSTEIAKNHWLVAISDGNKYADQFTQKPAPRNPMGDMPRITTNKRIPQEIIRARVEEILSNDNSFEKTKVQPAEVFAHPDNFYIVNYWPENLYMKGHIPGAIQYSIQPTSDLQYSTALKTLPTDKPIAVYCFTGQTSALMSAYLQVLGYDAKSIYYGVNAMHHKMLPMHKFVEAEIKDYPLVK